MSTYGKRNNNAYNTNGRNRRGRGGQGRGGQGRGRGGGRGGRGKGQDVFTWTAGGGPGSSPATGAWTAGGGDDYSFTTTGTNATQFEDLDYPREPQSGLLFGLTEKVVVPGSVNHSLLQGEILETLKRMRPDIVNLMLAQYDTCAREGGIRNKNAYLLGIINSGPRMGLPQGVVVPPSVKFSLMQGVVLDDLNALSVDQINVILGEFDKDMRERGSTVYDKYSYLADIIRKHKPATPKRKANHNSNQFVIGRAAPAELPPVTPNAAARAIDPRTVAQVLNHTAAENGDHLVPDGQSTDSEMEDTLGLLANSLERVQLLTESVAKVTGELVSEKEKRSSQEAIARSEQILRLATEERLQTALSELEAERQLLEKAKQEYETTLKYENDRRQAMDKEVNELKEKIEMERAEKHRAEDRLSVLEEVLISERDVRDQERDFSGGLPGFDSAEFDSDCDSQA